MISVYEVGCLTTTHGRVAAFCRLLRLLITLSVLAVLATAAMSVVLLSHTMHQWLAAKKLQCKP